MVAFLPHYEAKGSHTSLIDDVTGKEPTGVNPLLKLRKHGENDKPYDKTGGGNSGPPSTSNKISSTTSSSTTKSAYGVTYPHSATSTLVSSPTSTPVSDSTGSTLPNDTSPSPHNTPLSSANLSPQAASLESGSPSQQIPTWAIPVIVIVGLIVLVFLASLAIFGSRERRRKNEIGGKDSSYARALGRAGAVATGLFIPIWIVKRCHRSQKKENQEQQEMYDSQIPAYGKLEQNRQSEEIVASTPPVRPAETALSPATLERGTSVVSSLSSSTRSQGRYERLDMPPSPMSEDGLYPWKSNDPSETASGNLEKREDSTGPAERTRVETPLARRSDSMSEKRVTGG
ncbi:uncharacterized protein F4817DRAFT_328336 [Daldinia loculata]|uniref:uncharacterized protein n=1 Tax=Daldinia loculata TaxID=103429 RepID=UPI0020C4EF7F|nr:uncharacterized protein F4817DRAFT_328336 [Daldinia loculata]KAI1650118.1 hypothetical protein F4817DRAFT_328336 [Daldinia loculata]